MSNPTEEDDVVQLPAKSKSLRAKSIQKRLETERNKKNPRQKCKGREKSYIMSKYRRKAANAKERERMKMVNEAFDRLKSVVPIEEANQQTPIPTQVKISSSKNERNTTKVTTLRFAIDYIKSLQQLIEDSNNGRLDPALYSIDNSMDEAKRGGGSEASNSLEASKRSKRVRNKSKGSKTKKAVSGRKQQSLENNCGGVDSVTTSSSTLGLNLLKMKHYSCHDFVPKKRRKVGVSANKGFEPPFFVIMSGAGGAVYGPSPHLDLTSSSPASIMAETHVNPFFPSVATSKQQPLYLDGTSIPVPLQPLALSPLLKGVLPTSGASPVTTYGGSHCSDDASSYLSETSSDCLSPTHLLPSLDMLFSPTSQLVDGPISTLDDIQQVLKDAENFDILA